jgi:hypothetical protein
MDRGRAIEDAEKPSAALLTQYGALNAVRDRLVAAAPPWMQLALEPNVPNVKEPDPVPDKSPPRPRKSKK